MIDNSMIVKEFPEHPLLGRKFAVHDPASRLFAAVGRVATDDAPLRTRTHRRYHRAYDQGETSECVAYSAKGMINTSPLSALLPSSQRLHIETTPVYKLAQTLDVWPGESYDGTSVLAGCKALKQLGLIREYRWCFGLDDVLKTLSSYGPVTIGIAWYNSMFRTDSAGNLTVDYNSGLAGGHAVEIIGINTSRKTVVITNSWGERWGDRGRCYMSWDDLGTLLEDYGEALTYL